MTSRSVAYVVGLLLAGSTAGVRAAAPGAEPAAGTEASQLVAEAVTEYDAGRYDEARALFRQAHQKAPTARTLRGIGMASFELRDYVDATRALTGALRDARRPLTDEQRKQVEALLARAETFVGRFTPRVQPVEAELLVDGQAGPREADGSLLLGFGHHRIAARCSSCSPSEKQVEVDVLGGERKEIEIVFAGDPQTSPGPPTPSASAIASVERSKSTGSDRSAFFWWGGASLAAALGTGAGAIWWVDRAGELDTCRAAGDRCKNESTVATQRDLAIGVTVGLGAAAVASGIMAARLWPGRSSSSSEPVACIGGRGIVSCAFRF